MGASAGEFSGGVSVGNSIWLTRVTRRAFRDAKIGDVITWVNVELMKNVAEIEEVDRDRVARVERPEPPVAGVMSH